MTELLETAFEVRRDERRLVLLFFAFFAGVGMFYTVGATVGDTLLLSNLPPPDVPRRLPWVYLGVAVSNVLSTLAFDRLQTRVSRTQSIVGTQLVLAASVLLARKLVEADSETVYLLLVIWLETCALLSITLFFSFAGDYFSPRDARRLYGFIAGGMALGTVISGYAINLGVGWIGTENLLYVGAVILLANAAIAGAIYRTGTPIAIEAEYEDADGGHVSLAAIFGRPYVRLLSLIVPLGIVMYVTVDYQMKWIASALSEQELARFFGSFFGWIGLAQLLFQFGFAQRLLRWLGIIPCLMILPLSVGAASALLYAGSFVEYFGFGILALSASVNFLRLTLSETLDLPSRELLFLPLPTRLRRRLQPLMSGAFAPSAQGLAALLMLLSLRLEHRAHTLSLIAVACAGALLAALVQLRPKYRETLAATLRDRQLDPTDLERVMQSANAEELLRTLLRSQEPEVVKATIGLLAGRNIAKLGAELEELVDSPDAEIAVAALERLSAEKHERTMGAIQRAWSSRSQQVRQAAVLALCEAAGEDAVGQLAQSLESHDPALRTSAVIGLARYCGASGQALVRPELVAQAESTDPAQRAEAARLLERIGSAGFANLLCALLRDSDPQVRLAAAEACASASDPRLAGALLAAMVEPELRAACIRALSAMPESAVAEIGATTTDGARAVADRCALLHVLGRIGGEGAVAVLWRHADEVHDPVLRLAAAESLRAMRAAGRLPQTELEGFEARIDDICDGIGLLNRALAELSRDDGFVREIFLDHARMQIELLCALLALRCQPNAVDRVQYSLFEQPAAAGAQALELIEEMLPRRLSRPVVAALQGWLEGGGSGGSGLTAETRARLIAAEPWLRVVTVHHLNQGAACPTLQADTLSDADRELYTRLDAAAFLKRVPLLRDLPAHYALEQAELAEWRAIAAGDVLFREGDRGDELFIICRGEIDVRVGEQSVARLCDGECIGELAVLDGEPRSATAVATCDTVLLRVSASRLKHLLVAQPAAARALLRTLDRRIRETQAGPLAAPPAAAPPMRRSQLMRAQKLGLQQLVATMSFLRQVDLFRELSTKALANVAGIAQEVTLFEGDALFEEGDAGESLYLVCTGRIAITVGGRRVAELERNACLGEMALVGGLPRSASAYALSEARLLRIGSDDFMNLLATQPEIALSLLRTLARRLRYALRRNTEQGRERAPGQIAAVPP